MGNLNLNLNRQILVLALLPLLLLSMIFISYFVWSQTSQSKKILKLQGDTITKLIASRSSDAIRSKDIAALTLKSSIPLKFKNVVDIIFLDRKYQVIYRSTSFPLRLQASSSTVYDDSSHWYFVRPALNRDQPLQLFSSHSDLNNSSQVIGWVIVVLSKEGNTHKDLQIILSLIGILIAILMLSYWAASRFAMQITTPISEIRSVVNAVQQGDFDTRARETHAGQLHSLAVGINTMALRIKVSTTDMETRVDSATLRLQSAMYHLEQKNEILEVTKEKEVEANQAKDQFLARMSHELRTPLTSVLGFSKILQEMNYTAEQAEPIRIINQTSKLLLAIVDDILDYSKLQKNAITLESIDFNLETAILDILEMQTPMAHSKGLELSLTCENVTSYEIKGDPTRFKQIIINLVSNAIKFTDSGSVALNADVQYINSHQSLIIISVTDTGIGISSQQLNTLFKAFVQADTSITRRFGGSGLGLIIAKTLTKLMGGKLEIYSKLGRGTNVTLKIPTRTNNKQQSEYKAPFSGGHSILIYEENVHAKRSMSLLLERKKYRYRSTSKIDELVQLLPHHEHVIIGIHPKDTDNDVINAVLKQLGPQHKIITLAVPSGHPLPIFPKVINLINKPIRPQTIVLHEQDDKAHKTLFTKTIPQAQKICAVVAEDNTFNQVLISRILEKNSIRCHMAANGLEALELIEKYNPDIAIIDIHMPVMDGFEATKIIRQNSNLPIISLTANIMEQDHQKIISAGSNCLLLKPINDVQLIRSIAELTSTLAPAKEITSLSFKRDIHDIKLSANQPHSVSCPTEIEDYNLNQKILQEELLRLLTSLCAAFTAQNTAKMKSVTHQLLGLAGLCELPEVELTSINLQKALNRKQTKNVWYCLFRLNRTIKKNQIESKIGS